MINFRKTFAIGTSLWLVGVGSTAQAAVDVDLGKVVAQTCDGIDAAKPFGGLADLPVANADGTKSLWRAVAPDRAAYFMASNNSMMLAAGDAAVLIRAFAPDNHHPQDSADLWDVVESLQKDLEVDKYSGVLRAYDASGTQIVTGRFDARSSWLLGDQTILRCKLKDTTPASDGGGLDIRLRGTVAALQLTGDDRAAAPAASVTFERAKADVAGGGRQTTTTWTVQGVLGVGLIPESDLHGLMAYIGYEYKGARLTPPPTLVPPATQRDSDTDILKLGLQGNALLKLGEDYNTSLNLSLDGSYLFDFVNDSEKFRARVTAGLYMREDDLGICYIGGYRYLAGISAWSRCDVAAIADFNVVTKPGSLVLGGKETYGHIGGTASIAFYFSKSFKSGPFATAEYTLLQRVGGLPSAIPDIDRVRVTLGQRWWSGNLGFEAKAEFIDGENPDSFADENRIMVGFGLIF